MYSILYEFGLCVRQFRPPCLDRSRRDQWLLVVGREDTDKINLLRTFHVQISTNYCIILQIIYTHIFTPINYYPRHFVN